MQQILYLEFLRGGLSIDRTVETPQMLQNFFGTKMTPNLSQVCLLRPFPENFGSLAKCSITVRCPSATGSARPGLETRILGISKKKSSQKKRHRSGPVCAVNTYERSERDTQLRRIDRSAAAGLQKTCSTVCSCSSTTIARQIHTHTAVYSSSSSAIL